MISFVPFAISIQNELPEQFPKFVFSLGEVAFFTNPAALLQFSYWSDDEGMGFGGDFLWLSLLYEAWVNRGGKELDIVIDLEDKEDND